MKKLLFLCVFLLMGNYASSMIQAGVDVGPGYYNDGYYAQSWYGPGYYYGYYYNDYPTYYAWRRNYYYGGPYYYRRSYNHGGHYRR